MKNRISLLFFCSLLSLVPPLSLRSSAFFSTGSFVNSDACTNLPAVELVVDTDQCLGESYVVSINTSADLVDFQWFANGDPVGSNADQIVLTPQFFGSYTLSLEALDADGCDYFASLPISVAYCPIPCEDFMSEQLLVDGFLCVDSTITIFSPITDPTTGYFWSILGGGTSFTESITATFTEPGEVFISLQIGNASGCQEVAIFSFIIEDCSEPCSGLPDILITTDTDQCLNAPFYAFVQSGMELTDFQWFLNGLPQTSNADFIEIISSQQGINLLTIEATDETGCTYFSSLEIQVQDCEDPCFNFEIGEIIREGFPCVDSLLTFSTAITDPTTNYSWAASNGATDDTETLSTIFSLAGPGSVSLTATNGAGCTLDTTFTVNIGDCPAPCFGTLPLELITQPDQCLGETYLVTINTSADLQEFQWSVNGSPAGNNSESVQITPLIVGGYTVSLEAIDNEGCIYSASLFVPAEYCPPPCETFLPESLTIEGYLCVDSVITFSTNITDPTTSYFWNAFNGNISGNESLTTLFQQPGEVSITLSLGNAAGCQVEGTYSFFIEDCTEPCSGLPPVSIITESEQCLGQTYLVSIAPGPVLAEFQWFLNGSAIGINAPSITITPSTAGLNLLTLEATGADGCVYTSEQEFLAIDCDDPCLGLEIPSLNAIGALCKDSLLTFSAQVSDPAVSYSWSISNGTTADTETISDFFPEAGSVTVTLVITNTAGCSAEITQSYVIEDCSPPCIGTLPFEITTEPDQCLGETYEVTIITSAQLVSYQWSVNGLPAGDNSSLLEVIPLFVGGYTVSVVGFDSYGCVYEATLFVPAEYCPPPCDEFLNGPLNVEGALCVDSILTFSTNITDPTTGYFWSIQNGGFSVTETITASFSQPGVVFITLLVSNAAGCQVEETFVFQIEDCSLPCTNLPPVNILADAEQCVGEIFLATLETDAILSDYQWLIDGVVVSSNEPFYESLLTEPGTFTLSIIAEDTEGCSYETSVLVEGINCEDPCENFELGPILIEGPLCLDSALTIIVEPLDTTTDYFWEYGVGQTATTSSFTTSFSETGPQTLFLSIINAEGCEDEAILEIQIEDCTPVIDCPDPLGSVQITPVGTPELCVGTTIQLSFASEFLILSALWELSDGQTSTEFSPTIEILSPETLTITLTAIDDRGCTYLDVLTLGPFEPCGSACSLYIPSVFSPDANGINDQFQPLSGCQPEVYLFQIFDRWGELVFETTQFDQPWDGNFRGTALQAGVYIWLTQYQFPGQPLETRSGDVTIVR